jgi:hypothetical protein
MWRHVAAWNRSEITIRLRPFTRVRTGAPTSALYIIFSASLRLSLYTGEDGSSSGSTAVNCETLKTYKECAKHDHCTPIEGDVCAAPGTTDKEVHFGYCLSSVVAKTYASKCTPFKVPLLFARSLASIH